MSDHITATESAKCLRADLLATFPATPFSVRKQGRGNTYHVEWTDGPTVKRVEEVIGRYESKGFDGMTDCGYYKNATDSRGRPSAIGYLFTRRELSVGFVARLIAAVGSYWGAVGELPTPDDYRAGRLWNRYPRPEMAAHHSDDWQSLINRAAEDRETVSL